jgi:hypothetical protein
MGFEELAKHGARVIPGIALKNGIDKYIEKA